MTGVWALAACGLGLALRARPALGSGSEYRLPFRIVVGLLPN